MGGRSSVSTRNTSSTAESSSSGKTVAVVGGNFSLLKTDRNGRTVYRARVFSMNRLDALDGWEDVFSVNKDPYVKTRKGTKKYLKNMKISSDGTTLYV